MHSKITMVSYQREYSEKFKAYIEQTFFVYWLNLFYSSVFFFYPQKPKKIKVFLSDCNSEIGAHARRIFCYLICLRHLINQEESQIVFFFSEKTNYPSCVLNMFWVTSLLTEWSIELYFAAKNSLHLSYAHCTL